MGFSFTPQQLFVLVALPNLVGLAAAAAVHLRGAEVRRPQLDHDQRGAAAGPDAALRDRGAGPEHAVLGLLPDRRDRRLRRRQLRQLDGQHQLLLPRRPRRAPRSASTPRAATRASRSSSCCCRSSSAAPGSSGWSRRARAGSTCRPPASCTPGWPSSRSIAAYLWMDNLTGATSKPREQLQVVRKPHTWIMAFLYIGTFGSFIGYSAAMPLLIKLNFWVPEPAPLGTGIYFAYFAFLGAAIGSVTRPVRRLARRQVRRREGHPRCLRRHGRLHAGGAGDADAADAEPDRRPGHRERQPVALPVVPRVLPLHLRLDRHRQRLDVQDDPGDLAARGRDHDRGRDRPSGRPRSRRRRSRPARPSA